jgi:hypothetical protein
MVKEHSEKFFAIKCTAGFIAKNITKGRHYFMNFGAIEVATV